MTIVIAILELLKKFRGVIMTLLSYFAGKKAGVLEYENKILKSQILSGIDRKNRLKLVHERWQKIRSDYRDLNTSNPNAVLPSPKDTGSKP